MDIEYEKEELLSNPRLYEKGIKGELFSTKVFWLWNVYAMYQALLVLFTAFYSSSVEPLADGKTYSFWASGHVVYFQCILLANLVMLRQSSNLTGWNELLLFLQVTSFFWILYLDSVIFTSGTIAYFSDEFYSSVNAVLSTIIIAFLIYLEKMGYRAVMLLRSMIKNIPE